MFIQSVSRRQLWSWVEWLYASIVIFALTQGPIYQLWRESALTSVRPGVRGIDASIIATFLALQLPGVMLFGRRVKFAGFFSKVTTPLLFLVGWLVVSVIWATLSRHTVIEAVALATTVIFGLYLAESFGTRRLVLAVFAAMQAGVVLSLYAVSRSWVSSASDSGDSWAGIYFNRNSLGPVAAVGLLCALSLAATRWHTWWRPPMLSMAYVLSAGLDAYVLIKSRSQTSQIFVVAAGFMTLVLFVANHTFGKSEKTSRVVSTFLTAVVGLAVTAIYVLGDRVVVFLGESSDVNGRTQLWSFSWSGFLEKPIVGWGWLSAWHTPEFFKRDLFWTLTNDYWSHSTYLDILLGGGVVAFVFFAVYVLLGLWRVSQYTGASPTRLVLVAFVVLVMLSMSQESFFIGSHFYTMLLVASMRSHEIRAREV